MTDVSALDTQGSFHLPQDPVEALLWLNRAVRGLDGKPTAPCSVAAKAFLLLGYLHFDGEVMSRV